MAVYVIAGYNINDPKGYEGYVPGVRPGEEDPPRFDARRVYCDCEGIQGSGVGG